MAEDDYDVACQKFFESLRVDPAPGTLLNLGKCEEKRGRIATSWERYTQAIALLDDDDRRREFALQKASELEPDVPRLIINLHEDSPTESRVTRNGHELAIGEPIRLNPGEHTIVVEAKGFSKAEYDVELAVGDSERLEVSVGKRIPEATNDAVPRAPAVVAREPTTASTVGYVFVGGGVASGVAAATFGVMTHQKYQVVSEHCDLDAQTCSDSAGQRAAELGSTYEILTYSLGGASIVLSTVGAYLLLTDDDESPPQTTSARDVRLEAGNFGDMRGIRLSGKF